MSDEQDSWFQSAFGLNIGGVADRIRSEAEEAAGKVQSAVQSVKTAVGGVLDDVVETVTDVAKKVAGAAGAGGGGSGGGGGGAGGGGPKTAGPAGGGTGSFPLSGSVGRGGRNAPGDVKAVQKALGIGVDGDCGSKTIAAIEAFQRNMGQAKPDGRVDAGGATERTLASGKRAPHAINDGDSGGLLDRLQAGVASILEAGAFTNHFPGGAPIPGPVGPPGGVPLDPSVVSGQPWSPIAGGSGTAGAGGAAAGAEGAAVGGGAVAGGEGAAVGGAAAAGEGAAVGGGLTAGTVATAVGVLAFGGVVAAAGVVAAYKFGQWLAEPPSDPPPIDENPGDPDNPKSGHGVGGAPAQTPSNPFAKPVAGSDTDPRIAPGAAHDGPAIDPNTGLPIIAPGTGDDRPVVDPSAVDPALLPGLDDEAAAEMAAGRIPTRKVSREPDPNEAPVGRDEAASDGITVTYVQDCPDVPASIVQSVTAELGKATGKEALNMSLQQKKTLMTTIVKRGDDFVEVECHIGTDYYSDGKFMNGELTKNYGPDVVGRIAAQSGGRKSLGGYMNSVARKIAVEQNVSRVRVIPLVRTTPGPSQGTTPTPWDFVIN